jgi:hypothetical protein
MSHILNTKLKTISAIILVFLVTVSVTYGQEFRKAGTAGFVFLEIPVSSRSQAMGETGITLSDMHSEGLYINPALIALSDNPFSVNVTYANWYVETDHMAAGITYRIPQIGTVGLSIVNFDFGTINKTRVILPDLGETGPYIDLGTYTAQAYAIGLTYARELTEKFTMGITAKYVRENIDVYYADNFVFDIGFIYLTGFHSLRIGASLQSFGLETAYANEKFRMPQILKMGLSYDFFGEIGDREYVTVIAEAVHPSDANERVHLGLEAVLLGSVMLRTGYKFGYDDEDFTLGLGLKFRYNMHQFRADFSYMQHEYLEDTFRYTLVVDL